MVEYDHIHLTKSYPLSTSLAEPDVPHTLLEEILQSELPSDIFASNVSGNDTSPNLVDSMHILLATQLEVRDETASETAICYLISLYPPPTPMSSSCVCI